jgi:hypothetical protein
MYNKYEERNSLPRAETIAHDERYSPVFNF